MWDALPLWAIGLLLTLAMIVARELGDRAHRRFRHLADAPDSDSADEGFLLSGVLGLLALLLAFALSMALERHEQRRALVLAEADAISTLSHRLQLFDSPAAEQSAALLKAYGHARVRASVAPLGYPRLRAEARAEALGDRLTATILGAARNARTVPTTALIVQASDAVSDVASERIAATHARIPARVMNLLALYCVAAAAMLGYTLASTGSRHRGGAYFTFVLIAFAFATVADLDRPRSGAILVSQEPLIDTVARLP
jgi:hypothetical protein